ncbi:MAG: hypothetical protein LH609_15650 [Rudanella sp.]|nr:hypothetical protein [Rudanella sp.]
MDSLLRLIDCYLNSRRTILSALDAQKFGVTKMAAFVDVSHAVIFNRRRDHTTWRPCELARLANELHMTSTAITSLRLVAPQLVCLPEPLLRRLMRETPLDRKKLGVRSKDYNCWQYDELVLLASSLRRWQETNVNIPSV